MIVKAVERIGDKVRLLDQTRLPGEEIYHDYDDYRDIIKAIQRLEIRGAPAIGITAAYALAVAVRQSGEVSFSSIEKLAAEIKAARPTAVNLFWAVDRVLAKIEASGARSKDEFLRVIWTEAGSIHEEDRLMCQKIGENGSALFKDGDTILTHCNTGALATGGIGTALGIIYTCHEQGKKVKVFAGCPPDRLGIEKSRYPGHSDYGQYGRDGDAAGENQRCHRRGRQDSSKRRYGQ